MDEINLEGGSLEAILEAQLAALANRYFSKIKQVPDLEIAPASKDGPAWLNALEGTIYIDERVATFYNKTTKILILHELIHYFLYQENGDADEKETGRFLNELSRIAKEGAYAGLL